MSGTLGFRARSISALQTACKRQALQKEEASMIDVATFLAISVALILAGFASGPFVAGRSGPAPH
jgi:hypothetical protein